MSAPPDNTVFKGKVWSFTVETFSYTMTEDQITATASSQGEGEGPENTIDRSGLDEDDKHSILPTTMWLTAEGQTGPIWIQYEFDKTYKLHEMLVWNYNGPNVLWWFGIKEVVVEYSTDGINWYQVPDVNEFASATGRTGYATNITIPFDGVAAKYVRITATSNWSNGVFDQYGLSEVRFLYIPTYAREPNPDDEATDVAIDTTLSWRPGREAAEHNIYISTNQQAVIDGTATAMTVNQASYSPDLALGRTYFWRVDEVNNAEVTPIWEGDLFWTFGTQEYLVVDDFESYNDIPQGEENSNLVYLTWIDGYDNPSTNGSTMGYTSGASLDTETVRSGHSAPLMYNNTSAGISKITANTNNLQSGSDWTVGSPERLVLWIYGSADNPSTEQMYVEVDGVKKIFSGDISAEQWQDFTIDLTSLGINLSNVRSMTIGFEKTGATGGSGIVFIDDIRLYGVAPAPKIVYVDATDGQAGNTMLATGEVFMADDPGTTGSGADGLWRKRAGLSNDGTIFESGGDWGGNNVEDCPRLMTSVEVPEGNYDVYVYMWTGDTAPWRIAASLENSVGDLPLYICADPNGGTTLAVADDFEEPVPLLTESNRTLWQAYLGATGTTTTITVYIDDDANRPGVSGNGNDRTWYDGIGYKAVLPEE
ncbi:MAG: discoidin domain-containing protein [Sedimentisphaerales bacterium]|nr:discoidin domain-containing protein [Sedimentisphaerales bacterium]